MFFRNVNALVVSHTPGHAAYLFGIMLHIYDRMPWWLRPMCASREFKNSLWFENDVESERRRMPGLNSKVKVEAFNSRSGVGTGTSVSACHVCFAPGTLVHCTDGRLIPIQDIQYGESTVTSAGRVTSISGVYRSSRRDEVTAEITPWGCPLPLRTTLDHRIMTPNGYREAGSIKSGDWISMPVRPISSTRQCLSIERGRSDRTRYSEDMPCNFSTGWLFGLYLAEGSIAFNKKLKRYQARKVEFGIDFSEEERVVSGIRGAIGPERNIRTYRHSGSRTMSVDINDCGLSGFIDLHFGFSEEKRVPDWAWECGPDFCRGILSGYLSGDGHVAKSETGTASVSASSIRPAITIQMRDLVASLGMGWSSIFYRPSGHFYGRRCQAIWTLRFNGLVAHSAARLMGKECTQKTRDYGAKWAYASDGRSMHVQVKKVDRGFSEDFYDLEVEAEEHNFTTLQACVANSEYALVPDEDSRSVIEQDLAHALAENPETFAILESTGRGMNFAYRLWKKNVELHEQAEWETLFLPVFFERSRVAIPPPRWKPEAKEREMAVRVKTDWMRCSNPNCLQYFERYRGIVDRSGSQCTRCMEGICYAYDLSPEQMYWMQVKRKNSEKDDESRKKLLQELASTAIDCFQVSGSQLFSESERSWITSNVRPPDKLGFLDSRGKMHGCNYKVPQKISMGGDRYYPCYQPDCYEDHEFGDLNNEKPMQVWFEPELGAEYCIGADVAEGLGGEHDYSVAAVLKVNHGIPDHVVAIWRSNNIDPINFATVLNSLGRWYNEAMISPEVNRYDTTLTWLRFNLQYSNIYRWKHVDSINPNSNKLGWQTNQTSKPRLWQFMKTFLQQHLLYCYSEDFASELVTFTKEDDDSRTGGAEGESHDDVAIAVMIALYCAHETDWDENAGMVALRRPLTPDEAKWKITCQRCGFIWGSAYPPDGAIAVSMGGAIDDRSQCQRCKCRLLSATMNEEIVDQRQHVNAEKEIFRNMEDRANELFVPDYDML
jgi:hypothetical protein